MADRIAIFGAQPYLKLPVNRQVDAEPKEERIITSTHRNKGLVLQTKRTAMNLACVGSPGVQKAFGCPKVKNAVLLRWTVDVSHRRNSYGVLIKGLLGCI